jgi:hypothetical protein
VCAYAYAQTLVLPIDKTATPTIQDLGGEPSNKGIYVVPPARYSGGAPVYDVKQQLEIPVYANRISSAPGSFPAGVVAGYGPLSVLVASATTKDLPAATRALVISDNYDAAVSSYQVIEEAYSPAVLGLTIRDCSIWGYDDAGNGYASRNDSAVGQPNADNWASGAITDVADTSPITITTSAEEPKTGQKVTIAGTSVSAINDQTYFVTRTGDFTFTLNGTTRSGTGSGGTWTREDLYNLCNLTGTGWVVEGVRFFYCPGTCIQVTAPSGGTESGPKRGFDSEVNVIRNCKFKRAYRFINIEQNDAQISDIEGEWWADYGIRVRGASGGCKINGPIHLYGGSNSCILIEGGSQYNILTGPFYLENSHTGLWVGGSYNVATGIFSMECGYQSIMLNWTGNYNSLSNLSLRLNHPSVASTGIYWNQRHTDVTNCHIISVGSGDTGIVMGDPSDAPLDGNSIRGLCMDGDETEVVDGTTGIKCLGQINNTYIQADFQDLEVGLDLMDGTDNELGTGNTIIITATDCNVPLDLDGWGPGVYEETDNYITVNGVRWYPD